MISNCSSGYMSKRIENGVLKRYVHTHIPSSIIHNNQKVEAPQVSIQGRMGKRNVLYAYSRILFSLKKEGNSNTYYNIDELRKHKAK